MAATPPALSRALAWRLDALNFLLADVRGALGPFLNVYLVTARGWTQTAIGLATGVSGLVALLANAPAGALIDRSRAKRGLLALALIVIGLAGLVFAWAPQFWPVLIASTAMGLAGDLIGPAVAALTLGLVRRAALARRLARNSAFDHAGNIAIALLAGAVGYGFTQRAVFFLAPVFVALALGVLGSIPAAAIDHARARGAVVPPPEGGAALSFRDLLGDRPLMILAACVALFHFANAPLLVLVGQKLAIAHPDYASAAMAACIIGAQAVMLPIALAVAPAAERFGHKPVFLVGFVVLLVRALLYPLSDASAWLLGVQLLDGVGAGIYGALMPLLLADLMRGTGRYNLAQGLIATAQGVGASLSGIAVGVVVDRFGYSAGFLALGGVAGLALMVFVLAMPETARRDEAEA
ncbi:MAG: MFS transporter [Rhodospirillales bacterium]|nr:MFS transporter [Rhodospirillales bacterium]